MSQRHTDTDSNSTPTSCDLVPFLRNRYFSGKLLTTRDMQAEQDYHADRLETLGQHVVGEGVVCGLETAVSATDDGLVVSIEPGLAFDCCGRPIVVGESAEVSFYDAEEPGGNGAGGNGDGADSGGDAPDDEVPDSDEISVYIRLKAEPTETVPQPGTGDACSEDCEYNRIHEGYALELGAGEPAGKPIPAVEFPTKSEKEVIEGAAPGEVPLGPLSRPARTYAGGTTDGGFQFDLCGTDGDPQVFLGCFIADEAGGWKRKPGSVQRHYVYTNNMLYSSILSHATDLGNPHDVLTSVDGVGHVDGNIELESPSKTVLSTEGSDGVVNLDVDVAALEGVVKTVHGISPDGSGNVEFVSPSETIDPSQGSNGVVELDVNESALGDLGGGGIETIEGTGPDADGDVAFASPSGTIESDDDGMGVVNLDLSKEFRREHAFLGEYVRDKVLKYKVRTFYEAAEQFTGDETTQPEDQVNAIARRIVLATRDALDVKAFQDAMDFAIAVVYLGVLEFQLFMVVDQEELATEDSVKDYGAAIQRLLDLLPSALSDRIENDDPPNEAWEALLDPEADQEARDEFHEDWEDELDVTGLAVAEDQIAETVGWLDRQESMVLPGGDTEIPARIIRTAIDRPGRG